MNEKQCKYCPAIIAKRKYVCVSCQKKNIQILNKKYEKKRTLERHKKIGQKQCRHCNANIEVNKFICDHCRKISSKLYESRRKNKKDNIKLCKKCNSIISRNRSVCDNCKKIQNRITDNKRKAKKREEKYKAIRPKKCKKCKITDVLRSKILCNSCKDKNKYNLKIRRSFSSRIREHLKIKQISKCKSSITNYLPYTMQELKKHIESQFESWMTWNNWGSYNVKNWDDNNSNTWKWQIDHIIPHSDLSYDSMMHENFKKCWALNNLRPLSAKQNLLDGTRRIRHK